MSNNVNVSLDTSVTPNALNVHDHGNIRIGKKSTAQTITWNLTGVLAQGEFVPMTDPEPGFEWVSDPPPTNGIFGNPAPGANGNSISISDTHADGSSDGTWIYRLRVIYDGTIYSTQASIGPGSTIKDPVIVNH